MRGVSAADERDQVADVRDLSALARDQAAGARDLAMAQRDAADEQAFGAEALSGSHAATRADELRERAARHRTEAAAQRAVAAEDRHGAAVDRGRAAHDRRQALEDRRALADQLALTETDPLTGARTRAAGLHDLDNELDRSHRTGAPLVAAYVDAVGLKAVNDTEGHAAGDALLKRLVTFFREHLRPYDLIVRLGGDEFLCVMSGMTLAEARKRFDTITAALAAAPDGHTIRAGLAESTPDETAAELIARADSELTRSRQGRSGHAEDPTAEAAR